MSPEVVRTLETADYAKKWLKTLRQARKLRLSCPILNRVAVRVKAIGTISRPVFVLGCPRSGTTYLGSLLEALPRTTYFFEPPAFKYYARLVYEGKVSRGAVRRTYRNGFRALMLAAPGNGGRIVEKNPPHTWIAESLMEVFPDASFVIIDRDGRDVAASLLEKPWHLTASLSLKRREPGEYIYGPYPHFYIEPERSEEFATTCDIHRCIWIWRRHVEETERLRSVLPAKYCHYIKYEELINRPIGVLGDLLGFLDMCDGVSRGRILRAAESGRSSSIGRWQQKLYKRDIDVVFGEAGNAMSRLGYC